MSEKEWPACYQHCDNCDNLRYRDDLILVTDGAIDPDEKMICAQCASKQLSAFRNQVRALRNEVKAARILGASSPLGFEFARKQWEDAKEVTDTLNALEDER